MPAIMRKKVRSYLKGLAENRARAAGDVIRFEGMVAEVTQRLAEARLDLESCDRLIKKYDPRLQPECIVPIRVWPHHKGKRGGLREKLLEIIEREAPEEVTLTEICYAIEISWELTFLTPEDRLSWRRDAVGRAPRRLATEGCIVALHSKRGGLFTTEIARWRARY
jgi:hypothetical protein